MSPGGSRPTSLPAVYAFTFINSLGTGVITGALFFLADSAYGFTPAQNFLLGVVQGITYIFAAAGAGKLVAALARRRVPPRTTLCTVMLGLAALCFVPLAVKLAARDSAAPPAWPIWLLAAAYMPLTGILWPMTESYLSGGRSGAPLRKALAAWNVVWSSAIPITYIIIAPFIRPDSSGATLAAEGIAVMGGVHVIGAALLALFPREPAPHVEHHHEPHPPVFERLLVSFRFLLPTSYLVQSALTPYLPTIMNALQIEKQHHTIAATAWLLPRVATFAVFGFWGSWHGRWWPTIAGAAGLLIGFAICVAAPMTVEPLGLAPARTLLFVGLPIFGMGMGIIYSGAIYYALEVGKAEVNAGGTHEALIGVGYCIGPGCGLLAALAVERGMLKQSALNPTILMTVGGLAIIVCALVARRAVRRAAH